MVRIRLEHAIGFLKGRFHSLKELRVNIKDETTHKFATYWVVACVGVHSFAMRSEAEERGDSDEEAVMADPFINEGLSSSSDSEANAVLAPATPHIHSARTKREYLKRRLFKAKDRRKRHRAQRQRRELGMSSDGESNQ